MPYIWGALLEYAIENKIEYILLPSGFQPRAAIDTL